MRRTLCLLLAAAALSACGDAVAPTAGPVAPSTRDEIPWVPDGSDGIQSLSASISGPGTVGNYTTCTYTSTVSGGTPPYTYSWGIAGASGGYLSLGSYNTASVQATGYYYGGGSGTGSVYLLLTVTDANSLTAYAPAVRVYIPSSSTSC
jgi:hypothetical protein